jgi:CHAT domain-containing protein
MKRDSGRQSAKLNYVLALKPCLAQSFDQAVAGIGAEFEVDHVLEPSDALRIVDKARTSANEFLTRGDEASRRNALEAGLEVLSAPGSPIGSPEFLCGQLDLLSDLGKYEDCPILLQKLERSVRAHGNPYTSPDDESDADSVFRTENDKLKMFDRAYNARDWDMVCKWARKLGLLEEPIKAVTSRDEGIKRCIEHFQTGVGFENMALKEVDKIANLQRALSQYWTGCDLIEICSRVFDDPKHPMTALDHNICANSFISAARICLRFDELRNSPSVATLYPKRKVAAAWGDQALELLEQGRSRSLQHLIKRFPRKIPETTVYDELWGEISTKLKQETAARNKEAEAGTALLPEPLDYIAIDDEPSRERTERAKKLSITIPQLSSPKSRWIRAIEKVTDDPDNEGKLARYPIIRSALQTSQTKDELKAKILQDTIVVEFAQASEPPEGLITIIITSEKIERAEWRECNIRDLNRLIEKAALSMWPDEEKISPEEGRGALQELADILLKPWLGLLRRRRRIVLVTSGNLAHVPWSMLPLEKPLVETNTVVVVPSLSVWNLLKEREYPGGQSRDATCAQPVVSVLSNSPQDVQTGILRDIPYSRVEALHIAQTHEKMPILADFLSLKELEKVVGSVDILHLCAHGEFDAESPWSSKIHLCKESLRVVDLSKMNLSARLVVFSSCFSSLARGHDSGSAFGFSSALLGSGAQCFIGTLWPVDDAATMIFMQLFYRNLNVVHSPAESLRAAQETMRTLTVEQLQELLEDLRGLENIEQEMLQRYLHNPNYRLQRALPSLEDKWEEFRDARAWAGFVLTGYGDNIIYTGGEKRPLEEKLEMTPRKI